MILVQKLSVLATLFAQVVGYCETFSSPNSRQTSQRTSASAITTHLHLTAPAPSSVAGVLALTPSLQLDIFLTSSRSEVRVQKSTVDNPSLLSLVAAPH